MAEIFKVAHSPYGIGQTIIFLACGLMSAILPHMVWS